jgi:hypothetical protein
VTRYVVPRATPAGPGADDGWFIVVIRKVDGTLAALSRRHPRADGEPNAGPWRALTEDEAGELAAAYNADPRDESTAEAVEIWRYDRDPQWPEGASIHGPSAPHVRGN